MREDRLVDDINGPTIIIQPDGSVRVALDKHDLAPCSATPPIWTQTAATDNLGE
jgi:hypothetical protein